MSAIMEICWGRDVWKEMKKMVALSPCIETTVLFDLSTSWPHNTPNIQIDWI